MQIQQPKTGYKCVNTLFDFFEEIPEDWNVRPLGDFAIKINKRYSKNKEGHVLSVTKYKGFVKSLDYFKKQIFSKDIEKYKLVEKGDFAYATIHLDEGAIGLLKEFECGYISPMYTVFRTDNTINSDYLHRLLKTESYLQKYSAIGEGTVNRRKTISFENLSKLKIPLPPLKEQQQIASILSNVDSLIDQTQKIIEQTQKLKKGLMQKLLTRGIGHTKFKKAKWYFGTEIEIPKAWEILDLKKFCKPRQGLQIPITDRFTEPNHNRLPYITVKSVHSGKFEEYIENPTQRVVCNEDDVLFTRTGNTGEIITNIKGVFHNNFFLIDFDRKIMSRDYLILSLKQPRIQGMILSLAGSTTIPDLNHGDFLRLKITVPPLQEQQKIATILSNIDSQIQKQQNYKSNLETVKKGLMQKLLTGQMRVKV